MRLIVHKIRDCGVPASNGARLEQFCLTVEVSDLHFSQRDRNPRTPVKHDVQVRSSLSDTHK